MPGLPARLSVMLPAFLLAVACEVRGDDPGTGFEAVEAGTFESIRTDVGVFTVADGPARIDTDHARTGGACLHLAGPRTTVVLELAEGVDGRGILRFHAERWTARAPWAFQIEARRDGSWTALRDCTDEVIVGRGYRSVVQVALGDDPVDALRFSVESPAGTGLLIDDLEVVTPRRQALQGFEMLDEVRPVLVGRASSPVSAIALETAGTLDPLEIRRIRLDLDGTTARTDLESVIVRLGPGWDDPATRTLIEVPPGVLDDLIVPVPEGVGALQDGRNEIRVGCRIADDADLDHRIGIRIRNLSFQRGEGIAVETGPEPRRLGVALRQRGDDDVDTYRIPGLATTNAGTLIAVYDLRRSGGGDLPGDIDVGLSRSTDGGRTWAPMRVIMDMGADPAWRHDGIGDPTVLVDRRTGTIWVAALWSHGDRGWHGSGPGLAPAETGQFMLVRSDDDGVTWSAPINITSQVKDPAWSLMLQGPGKGITMADGTLVLPAQYRSSPATGRVPHSTIIHSRDRGRTWEVGTGAHPHTTESQVVEIEPGVLMLNCRYDLEPARVVMISEDLGASWTPHPTSRSALVEPRACMASLIDVDREITGASRGRLLFSNPDDPGTRRRTTIKGSVDAGDTWPSALQVLLDDGSSAGYSCLAMIDERTVGILYEGSQAHLTFQRIPLAELLPAEAGDPGQAVDGDSPVSGTGAVSK